MIQVCRLAMTTGSAFAARITGAPGSANAADGTAATTAAITVTAAVALSARATARRPRRPAVDSSAGGAVGDAPMIGASPARGRSVVGSVVCGLGARRRARGVRDMVGVTSRPEPRPGTGAFKGRGMRAGGAGRMLEAADVAAAERVPGGRVRWRGPRQRAREERVLPYGSGSGMRCQRITLARHPSACGRRGTRDRECARRRAEPPAWSGPLDRPGREVLHPPIRVCEPWRTPPTAHKPLTAAAPAVSDPAVVAVSGQTGEFALTAARAVLTAHEIVLSRI